MSAQHESPAVSTGGEELDPVFLLADTDPDAMKAMNADLVAGFRASGGHLGGDFEGVPLLLLTTTGARTGNRRTTPVLYTRDSGIYVVIASKSGAATHPDWYHNLRANPRASIEVGGQQRQVRARIADGDERQRLFGQHAAALPNYAAYQRRTSRRLPVIVLDTDGAC
jgi:deazaflavin-dependent oxidoreductase (nitroreductase family)